MSRSCGGTVVDPGSGVVPREIAIAAGLVVEGADARRPPGDAVTGERADVVIAGGRVIDPATELDAIRDVVVRAGRISEVSSRYTGDAARWIDASGKVVAPGFIDLHNHCRRTRSLQLRAMDGVTTAFELESGASDVSEAYSQVAAEGSPINIGFSASWTAARMRTCGIAVGPSDNAFDRVHDPAWRRAIGRRERTTLLARLSAELEAGAIGVGVLLGYCPESDASEFRAVSDLAAERSAPTFTHIREFGRADGGLLGVAEVVAAAVASGCHAHTCHINSTSARAIDEVVDLLEGARGSGSRISSEMYPYGSGFTAIGAAFLAPSALAVAGLEPSCVRYLPTGERPATAQRLDHLRRTDPSGGAIVDRLAEDEPEGARRLITALAGTDSAVASDALDPIETTGGPTCHPRIAGTYGRLLRWMVRETRALTLVEAIRRCTVVPAGIVGGIVPAMRDKGTLGAGADADIVVFDPATVTDRATYREPTLPSSGFEQVLVGGELVVADGALLADARPGRPVRGGG